MSAVPVDPVLLVEDDHDLAANVQDYLERHDWRVDYAPNGALALHRLLTARHSAVILDLRLPGLGGLELCRRLRREAAAALPVLMLTAADTLPERLAGFEAGADDYLVKPFELPELVARLRALVRRAQPQLAPDAAGGLRRVEDLELDPARREVRRAGRPLALTNMGFALLELLMRRAPAVVTRDELEHHLWGDEPPGSDALRTHIAALRAAVDRPPGGPLLHTHRGIGYQLCRTEPPPPAP
jgi:DNA-binding response OmpR family regulator